MASLDEMEGSLAEILAGLIVLFVLVLVFGFWAAWKRLSFQSLYPDRVWSNVASGVDNFFNNTPFAGGPTQKHLDSFFGNGWVWINDHLPRSQPTDGSGNAALVDAGTNIGDYTPPGAAGS